MLFNTIGKITRIIGKIPNSPDKHYHDNIKREVTSSEYSIREVENNKNNLFYIEGCEPEASIETLTLLEASLGQFILENDSSELISE